jgi:hypothetical protein
MKFDESSALKFKYGVLRSSAPHIRIGICHMSENAKPGTNPPMSRYEGASLAVQVVGVILSVAALLFIKKTLDATNVQLDTALKQNRLSALLGSLTYTLDLDRVLLQNPEFRPYFYDGKDIDEKHPDFAKVSLIAETHLDVFEYALKAKERFPSEHPFPDETDVWIKDMLKTSPVMRRYASSKKGWYRQVNKLEIP